ncbi:MAG: permease [Candidatus Bathyarchaeia archaeon]
MLLFNLIFAGLYALEDYIALHTLTCLVPAFLLAGAITAFLSRETILRYMGSTAKKTVSFPLAAFAGIGLAVCSCTVIPIASGLYRRGSSLGPAFILLWTAPATNLLALVYTGAILGLDIAVMRIVAAVSTAFIVGLIMTYVFRSEERKRTEKFGNPSSLVRSQITSSKHMVLFIILIATLLLPNYLGVGRPYLHKIIIFLIPMVITFIYAWFKLGVSSVKVWLKEALWFVRLIFPLLLVGVFIIGIVGKILPAEWIQTWLGGNTFLSTFLASLLGALIYFATLTEAPFVDTLISLGMGKSPALALLLAGPGLSLPNMIVIVRIFTAKKALVYILTTIALAAITAFIIGSIPLVVRVYMQES